MTNCVLGRLFVCLFVCLFNRSSVRNTLGSWWTRLKQKLMNYHCGLTDLSYFISQRLWCSYKSILRINVPATGLCSSKPSGVVTRQCTCLVFHFVQVFSDDSMMFWWNKLGRSSACLFPNAKKEVSIFREFKLPWSNYRLSV